MTTDAELDELYNCLDGMMLQGRFHQLNFMLDAAIPEYFDTDYLIGVLTISRAARSKLPARAKFFDKVVEITKERGQHI